MIVDQNYGFGNVSSTRRLVTSGGAWPVGLGADQDRGARDPLMEPWPTHTHSARPLLDPDPPRPQPIGPLGPAATPIADALKLLTKEIILPTVATRGFLPRPDHDDHARVVAWV